MPASGFGYNAVMTDLAYANGSRPARGGRAAVALMSQPAIERFWSDCGGAEPLVLEVSGPDQPKPERVALRRPFAVVGSRAHSDLRLDGPDVSRKHAYLQLIA